MLKKDAIKYFGKVSEIAKILKIRHQSVSGWGEIVPLRHQHTLEILSNYNLKTSLSIKQQNTNAKNTILSKNASNKGDTPFLQA